MSSESRQLTSQFIEQVGLRPDTARALRQMVALGLPLLICHALGRPMDAPLVAMAAQTISLYDLRGAYGTRLMVLAAMTLVVAASAALGVAAGKSVLFATLAMGMLALLGGFWRHLSADYGPGLSVSSALFFLICLSQAVRPNVPSVALHVTLLVIIGGASATLLHAIFWLVRPQHPLRYVVAETWIAASDLVASMRPQMSRENNASGAANAPQDSVPRSEAIAQNERELRAALDRTFLILSASENRKRAAFIAHLEAMRREVVHFSMRAIALNTALESLLARPDFDARFAHHLPTIDSVLTALGDAARSVAITLITHRVENFAASKVRLRRCEHLIRVLDQQLAAAASFQNESDVAAADMRAALEHIAQVLPRIREQLRQTVDHAAVRMSFPPALPELGSRSLHSLAAWLNPAPHLDPVLVRYSARMAVLSMLAVALYKSFAIPRGYWIALTILVVLQPDYGSTRQRAAQRIGGTIAGSLLASALLWIKMPLPLVDVCAAMTCFGFGFFLRRNYRLAVFFVTLMVVLITETTAPVHLDFTIARLLSTLLGGGLALVAALWFWPAWEREKFPALLAAAIRANCAFLKSLSSLCDDFSAKQNDAAASAVDPLMAKRRAENANRFAAASLQRLLNEPGKGNGSSGSGEKFSTEHATALAAYNQRLTRALTALSLQLENDGTAMKPAADQKAVASLRDMADALESLAVAAEHGRDESALAELAPRIKKLEQTASHSSDFAFSSAADFSREEPVLTATQRVRTELIWNQIAKAIAEIRAMALALESAS